MGRFVPVIADVHVHHVTAGVRLDTLAEYDRELRGGLIPCLDALAERSGCVAQATEKSTLSVDEQIWEATRGATLPAFTPKCDTTITVEAKLGYEHEASLIAQHLVGNPHDTDKADISYFRQWIDAPEVITDATIKVVSRSHQFIRPL